MNVREYIESGTLELYSAGLLSIEEMRDVELKACQYPEIKTELTGLQFALETYALKYAINPPLELKSRIIGRISNEANTDLPQEKSSHTIREISSAKKSSSFSTYLAAASIALLIVAGVIAFRYASQVSDYQNQVAEMEKKQSDMQGEMNSAQQTIATNQEHLVMLSDTNTMHIAMKGTAKSPSALAMIYWNKQSQTVYLDIKNLPAAPANQQYQLWFIDPVKGPVSAGVFDVANGIHKMTNAPVAAAFAVTLEPRGGSSSPHLDQMMVIGMVNS